MSERWVTRENRNVATPKVDAFLAEVREVCVRHGLCIGHEDTHGAFIVSAMDGDESFMDWLGGAMIDATIKPEDR